MATNTPTSDKAVGTTLDSAPEDCPLERLETTIEVCVDLLDRAISPQRTVLSHHIARETEAYNPQQIGYAMRALCDGPETVAERLGYDLPIEVEVERQYSGENKRYWIRPAEQLVTDGGTDPLAGLDGLTAGETAIVLAVRLAGPLNQVDLVNRGVVSAGLAYGAVPDLVDAGLIKSVKPQIPNKPGKLYDPNTQERPDEPAILPDGGTVHVGQSDGPQTVEVKTHLPETMVDAIDDFVSTGAYASRAELVRTGARRELRLANPEIDGVADEVQTLYDHILRGKRPEAVAQCEQLAERLGVTLSREVLEP